MAARPCLYAIILSSIIFGLSILHRIMFEDLSIVDSIKEIVNLKEN